MSLHLQTDEHSAPSKYTKASTKELNAKPL